MRTFVCTFFLYLAQVCYGQIGGSSGPSPFDCRSLRPGGPGLTMLKDQQPSPANESSFIIHVDLMDRSIQAGQKIAGNVYLYSVNTRTGLIQVNQSYSKG